MGNHIFVSTYFEVSDTPAHRHNLWHGQWLCPLQGLARFVLQHIYLISSQRFEWERESGVMENTSVEHKIENGNGKKQNLLHSETEKGKIWNGKSVPLLSMLTGTVFHLVC